MIKKILYLVIFGSLIALQGCDMSLEPQIYTRLSPENYPQTEEDYKSLVAGIYGQFQHGNAWYRYSADVKSRMCMNELGTDEIYIPWEWAQRPQSIFDYNPGYDLFASFYQLMMPSVTKATYAIAILKQAKMDNEALKNRLIAEVMAVRGLWLYDLESFYGPVQAVLDEEKALHPEELYFPPRLSEDEYLEFVEKDLKWAMQYLPIKYDDADYGHFTKGGAASIVMKMYMHHKQWAKAVAISDSIMTYGYELVTDYPMIWDINNEKNAESIVVLCCEAKYGNNANLMRFHCVPADWISLNGNKVQSADGYRVPWAIYDKFDPADTRLKTLIKDYYILKNKVPTLVDGRTSGRLRKGAIPLKCGEDPASDGQFQGNDKILIRYADILLLRAEALNEINGVNQESIDLINRIRDRAFLNNPDKQVNISQFPTQESLRDYILQERQFELYFEGERREDLIRHGKYISNAQERGVTGAQWYHVRYPIPSSSIVEGQGHIEQNPGY
jgi:hypothetical protein